MWYIATNIYYDPIQTPDIHLYKVIKFLQNMVDLHISCHAFHGVCNHMIYDTNDKHFLINWNFSSINSSIIAQKPTHISLNLKNYISPSPLKISWYHNNDSSTYRFTIRLFYFNIWHTQRVDLYFLLFYFYPTLVFNY